jgi:streptogrisin D
VTADRFPRTRAAVLAAAGAVLPALLLATATPAGAAPLRPDAPTPPPAGLTVAESAAEAVAQAAGQVTGRYAVQDVGVPAGANAARGAGLQAVRALDALPSTPNTAWGVDPVSGAVVVTVSDAAQRAGVDRLLATAGHYGAPVEVRHTAAPLTEQILGGDKMDNGDVFCSDGFNVVKGGQPYILTAGHCTQSMKDWIDVGPSVESAFPGTDYGLVRNDSARPAPGAVDLYNGSSQPISTVGTATVGEHVCASGMATGYTCGTVTAVNQTVDYGDGEVVHGLIQTNVHTDHGDSGGPLFDGSTALGTVSGGDGTTDYFQPLAPELAAYGLTLAP